MALPLRLDLTLMPTDPLSFKTKLRVEAWSISDSGTLKFFLCIHI